MDGQPPWMVHAWRMLGEREIAGAGFNPAIVELSRRTGHADVASDEVPWCAAYVGSALETAGIASTRSLRARSYLDWGTPLERARLGAIAVLSRGTDPAAGHVGFWLGETADTLLLLGGNQSNAVSVAPFPPARLLGLRWPAGGEGASVPSDGPGGALDAFEAALAHVLEMEGGYSDDPHDPGGPTNFGVTIADLARERGQPLTAEAYGELKRALKAITPAQVRRIYLEGYWRPSRAGEMPAGIGLMHFDAAVNHGPRRAARLLQKAARVPVDGEIGPVTMGALFIAEPRGLIARYGEARREHYRSLPHFWRFGRGWLRRVERTVARASGLLARPDARVLEPRPRSNSDMAKTSRPNTPADGGAEPAAKWWGESLTIWGAFITTMATVLPVVGPFFGLDITGDLVRQLGDEVIKVAQAVGGLIGVALTVFGRLRASTRLVRRDIALRV